MKTKVNSIHELHSLIKAGFGLWIEEKGEKWLSAYIYNDETDTKINVPLNICEEAQQKSIISSTGQVEESFVRYIIL